MPEMQEGSSIKQMFQGMIPDGPGVVKGIVISEQPLQIQLVNDEKMVLHEGIICLPRHLTDYKTKVDIQLDTGSIDSKTDSGNCDSAHVHYLETYNIYQATMTVYNALKEGEEVFVLSFNNGKAYYILDREEEA